jgi:hypothetical protein
MKKLLITGEPWYKNETILTSFKRGISRQSAKYIGYGILHYIIFSSTFSGYKNLFFNLCQMANGNKYYCLFCHDYDLGEPCWQAFKLRLSPNLFCDYFAYGKSEQDVLFKCNAL